MDLFKVTCKCLAGFVFFTILSFPVFADQHYYAAVDFGTSLAKVGETATINLANPVGSQDTYVPNSGRNMAFLFGVHMGFVMPFMQYMQLSTGLGIEQALGYKGTGEVWSTYGASRDHTLNYKFKVNSLRLMLESRLGFKFKALEPFVMFGVGPALSEAYNYKEKACAPYEKIAPFDSKYNTTLAYEYGVGLAIAINKHDRIGFMYRDVYLGQINLGKRRTAEYPYKLHVGRLYADDFLLSLVHVF